MVCKSLATQVCGPLFISPDATPKLNTVIMHACVIHVLSQEAGGGSLKYGLLYATVKPVTNKVQVEDQHPALSLDLQIPHP